MEMFQVYPTLLNEFGKYLKSPDKPHYKQLLNRINRVPDFDEATLQRFRKGISFEQAVLGRKSHSFDPAIVEEVRAMLPGRRITQKLVQFTHQQIRFYGYADVVGERRVVDIKTTSSYQPGKYAFNFQNLYLYGLRKEGCERMDYIIYDFERVYQETYHLKDYDFGLMLHHMEMFGDFLKEHREHITDTKIFAGNNAGGLFGPGPV